MLSKYATYDVLETHYRKCFKYWMRNGCEERDSMLRALEDIRNIEYHPMTVYEDEKFRLDPNEVRRFKECRLMDLYGHSWREHIYEI